MPENGPLEGDILPVEVQDNDDLCQNEFCGKDAFRVYIYISQVLDQAGET